MQQATTLESLLGTNRGIYTIRILENIIKFFPRIKNSFTTKTKCYYCLCNSNNMILLDKKFSSGLERAIIFEILLELFFAS